MNNNIAQLLNEYLEITDNNVAAAATLTLAATNLVLAEILSHKTVESSEIESVESDSLTVKDAAKRLSLSSKKVYQMCQTGELQSFRAGRARRIPKIAIDRFESDNSGIRCEPCLIGEKHF